ncbi:MAG: Adenylate cyclase [Candidatus Magnetoglobus multicellularis str. Araruama]|uniref:Adenylate cyclase n=1 Tax=Candidatus Magnetoglobus multicellularis str. Araruama TaxID=890399 RepID=A0A1V1PC90_9BACT|nr:MAG: Adenylate cyclase [Candidatus Magnetoglobus multicellularis str. Araruama]
MKHIYKRYELWGLLLIFIATIFCEYYETLSLIEDQTLSYRQLIRTSFRKVKKVHEKNVVLVSFDDDYYEKTSVKPFRRSNLASIIENINKLGAKLIVVNTLMTYPDYSFEEDRALYQLLKKPNYDNVILSSHIEFGCNCTDGNIIFPSQTVWPQKISTGYINIISPSAVVTFLSRLRIYPSLVQKYSAWPLAIQAASQFLDISPRIDKHVLYLGDQAFQLDQHNDLYIDYSPVPMDAQFINKYMGLTATPFLNLQFPDNYETADQYFSITSDSSSEVDMQFIELLYWVKDKIVVIGDTSRDARNWFDTPVGTMYGSEIVADTISTLLSDSPLRPASLIVEELVSILMLSLILISVVKCHNARYSFLAYLCINILFTVLCAFVYSKYGYILTMTYNYLYGLVLYLATTVYYRTIDIRKKEQAYQKLEKAEEQYRAIFENAIEGLFLVDEKGKTIATNPATQQILGYDSHAELENILLDQDDNRLYVNKADHKKLVHLLKEKTVVKDFETRVFRKDKSWIWISFNVRKFKDRHSNKTIYEGFLLISLNQKNEFKQNEKQKPQKQR